MRRMARLPGATAIWLGIVLLAPLAARAAAGEDDPASPHWSKNGCPVCHVDAAPGSPNATLKADKAEPLCDACHGEDVRQCSHASGIPAGDFADSMPETYKAKLDGDKVVCSTCHDLSAQCLNPKKTLRYKNPGFVRDGRFNTIAEQCFLCHKKSAFKQVSPHMQVRGKDKIKEGTCLLCHQNLPDKLGDGSWGRVDFNMQGDLNHVCSGCHATRPHPGMNFGEAATWIHLSVPPIAIGEKMRRSEKETGAVLPVDPHNGRVFCSTCHNPHDKKLEGYPAAADPGSVKKLRVENICEACHEK